MKNSEYKEEKKKEIMEKCFECYCDNGIRDTNIKELGKYCGMTSANLYGYFKKVEDGFMELAPKNPRDILRFIDEVPYWTAREHGKKYRFMYQVYTNPKYIEYGRKFFKGVNERYTAYAHQLSPKLGIPVDTLLGFIYLFIRAAVHFSMFGDEYYLKNQMEALKLSVIAVWKEKNRKAGD